MRMSEPESKLGRQLTVKEAAELAGRSTAWVYDRLADGRMNCIREGRRIYVSRADLDLQRLSDRSDAADTAAARRHKKAIRLRSTFRVISTNP